MRRAALLPAERLDGHTPRAKPIALRRGAWQTADLAELADWVEGLRAAAHKARGEGDIRLAEALDITRFEVYEEYLRSARAAPLISRHPGLSSIGLSTAPQVSIAGMT